jgi:Zn-dependent peptidase ImmA (M78 family)
MQRLNRAGFSKEFVSQSILPDWWDDGAANDQGVLQDIEIRVARFLDTSVSALRDPATTLQVPSYAGAQLRRVRDVSRDRLRAAIHTAMRVASAVARNMRIGNPDLVGRPLPTNGLEWRVSLGRDLRTPSLATIASDLWNRGIAVVPLQTLPSPSFQGLACVVAGRPLILLGHKNDEPGRVAFLLAHEAGHIAAGDCQPDAPVVDEEDEIADTSAMEQRAELYATHVIAGNDNIPRLDLGNQRDFKHLAAQALAMENSTGADASAIIFGWARHSLDYATATMAVKALYRASGARRHLRELFSQHVDVAGAPETDRDLFRCVEGAKPPHEPSDRH